MRKVHIINSITGYTYDDLYVGITFRSPGRTITEADVVNFGGITGDLSELHTSDIYAARSPFSRRVAHGMLGLAYAHGLMWARSNDLRATAIAFIGINNWSFVLPIFIGDTILVDYGVIGMRDSLSNADRAIVTFGVKVVNQEGQTVQQGQKLLLCSKSPLHVNEETGNK